MTAPDGARTQSTNPAARNVAEIAALERQQVEDLSLGERISLGITNTAGTFLGALAHVVVFATWMAVNSRGPDAWRFDPYPFGLLTMIVSMEGVILAIFVLTMQNRMSRQTDRRDHLNLQVNLLAEQEMTMVLRMLDRIARRLGTPGEDAEHAQAQKLMEDTNIYQLMEELRKRV